MIPQIVQFGPIPVNSFGLMVALAVIAASVMLQRSFALNSINPILAEKFVFSGALSGLIGARVWYLAENWSHVKSAPFQALFASAGFTFYGGFIIAIITLYFIARKNQIHFLQFLDSVGPAMALGYAVGRLGCQLSGDGDYGMATTSWWGMSYETGVVPTPPGVLVYPTPLFESTASVLIAWWLVKVERSSWAQRRGLRFALYLALMSIERFSVEFIRVNERVAYDLSQAQIVAIGLMIVSTVLAVLPSLRVRSQN